MSGFFTSKVIARFLDGSLLLTKDLHEAQLGHLWRRYILERSNPFLKPSGLSYNHRWIVEGMCEYRYALRCG